MPTQPGGVGLAVPSSTTSSPWLLLFWLPIRHGITIGVVGYLIWFASTLIIQAQSGQSIGKMIFGIQVVHVTKVGQHQDEYASFRPLAETLTRSVCISSTWA